MAWNPSKEVAVARDAAQQLNADRVVIVYTTSNGQFGYASYGRDKNLCDKAKRLGDALFEWTREYFECDE
jgi:hypothetical protein